MIALIRVPYLSEYNLLDVREEPVISSLAGYLDAINIDFCVFDFHLDHHLTVSDIAACGADTFVVGVRGTGLHWKYAERVVHHLVEKTTARIVVYGQTGKLQHWDNPFQDRVVVVRHEERALASALGLAADGPTFEDNLLHYPYGLEKLPAMGFRRNLFKATIETTRGCHYGCTFCFINHGSNYPSRYTRRPNDAVLADMNNYINHGISKFWFYDSEFIGADRAHYPQVRELLRTIRDELPVKVEIMIYSRADTLERFGDYALLASAGVNSVLLGVESLDSQDLKAMRKGQTSVSAVSAVRALRDHKIFCNLSFILFNRTATKASIARNIEAVSTLYAEPEFIYLGQTLYFSYAFESDWAPNPSLQQLSGLTRLQGSTGSTRTPTPRGVTFDPSLEPYAEICRIINYEQVRKLCEVNLKKEERRDSAILSAVHHWAALLNLFTLNVMRTALDDFESGKLNLDTVGLYEEWVYTSYRIFNSSLLPDDLAATLTDNAASYPAGDWNGWEAQIPTPSGLASAATSPAVKPTSPQLYAVEPFAKRTGHQNG